MFFDQLLLSGDSLIKLVNMQGALFQAGGHPPYHQGAVSMCVFLDELAEDA
jgi:hypothetical protein